MHFFFFYDLPIDRSVAIEAVAAPAAEEASSPGVIDGGDAGPMSPPVGASAAAVVSSDDTSGKEDTSEGGSASSSCAIALWCRYMVPALWLVCTRQCSIAACVPHMNK